MLETFGFIKGVGFTLSLLASMMVGISIGVTYTEKEKRENSHNDTESEKENAVKEL